MRRIAIVFGVGVGSVLVGCHNAQPMAEPVQAADAEYGTLQPDLYVTQSGQTQPYYKSGPGEGTKSTTPTAPETLSLSASTKSMHVVAKGDTLYSLSRKYYGDASHWKEIYQANRRILRSADVLVVGQKLEIP